jgi:hypothetical protein
MYETASFHLMVCVYTTPTGSVHVLPHHDYLLTSGVSGETSSYN